MARSMWRGAIQFGLVTIPVKLYLATEQGGIGFNMLHKTCLNRIQMKVWCPYHEEVVSRSETVRGYEWTKDKYVVVTDEDLESVPLKTVRAIEIEKFVDEQQAEETASRFVKQGNHLVKVACSGVIDYFNTSEIAPCLLRRQANFFFASQDRDARQPVARGGAGGGNRARILAFRQDDVLWIRRRALANLIEYGHLGTALN